MKTAMESDENTLNLVRRLPATLENVREMLLANLVMIGEIPAPTYGEARRIDFLKQRFTECGLYNCSTDEVGNALGILPGKTGQRSILVAAHADTPFPATVDHTLSINANGVTGPGVADNSLGLAVLATLPTVLERLDIRLASDLVLMGASRSLGRGNLEGLRFFLANNELPIVAGISVEGAQLGRLNYASLASLDGEITCRVPEKDGHAEGGPTGAIIVLNQVLGRLHAAPLPGEPQTSVVLGAIAGGTSFKTPARSTVLRFQVRGESGDAVTEVERRIGTIVQAVAAETGAIVEFEAIARSNSGGLTPDAPLVLQTRRIMAALGIQPRAECCSSAVSSFIERGIPAITVGITTAHNLNEPDEAVAIEPMLKGLAELIGVLLSIDGGCCD